MDIKEGIHAGRDLRPVLSMLTLRDTPTGRQILIQRRRKLHDDTPYGGSIEVPQGKVPPDTTIDEFARFKLQHETGLGIVAWLSPSELDNSRLSAFEPFLCVIDPRNRHFAVAVVILAEGQVSDSTDAVDHRWLGTRSLEDALAVEEVFPLNRPMLESAIRNAGNLKLQP